MPFIIVTQYMGIMHANKVQKNRADGVSDGYEQKDQRWIVTSPCPVVQ